MAEVWDITNSSCRSILNASLRLRNAIGVSIGCRKPAPEDYLNKHNDAFAAARESDEVLPFWRATEEAAAQILAAVHTQCMTKRVTPSAWRGMATPARQRMSVRR